jgi:hypothetical protein
MHKDNTTATIDDIYAKRANIATKLAAFKGMDPIPLPVLTALVDQMDLVRMTGALLEPREPRDGMCVSLTSGVGKSTAARMEVRSAARRAGKPEHEGPVLLVQLDVDETVSLWSAILRALGDPYWNTGYPKDLKKRAISYLAKRKIEMIIVDEFNHSVDRGQARLLMNTVKEILNAGLASVVVMGTDEEVEKLPNIPAFERRMLHAPVIGPLRWSDPEDKRNWRGLLQGLDQGIVQKKILAHSSRLHATQLAKALCEACDGVLGYAYWVVQDALTEVLKRGGSSIERLDIAISVNRLFVKFEIYGRINAVEGIA